MNSTSYLCRPSLFALAEAGNSTTCYARTSQVIRPKQGGRRRSVHHAVMTMDAIVMIASRPVIAKTTATPIRR